MQQIVYDIIDNCFNYDKNINNENNSAHSDISITPPLSTKGCSNHSNKDSQKDTKSENKKILFSIQTSDKIKITKYKQNNIKNNNLILDTNEYNDLKKKIDNTLKRAGNMFSNKNENNEETEENNDKINIIINTNKKDKNKVEEKEKEKEKEKERKLGNELVQKNDNLNKSIQLRNRNEKNDNLEIYQVWLNDVNIKNQAKKDNKDEEDRKWNNYIYNYNIKCNHSAYANCDICNRPYEREKLKKYPPPSSTIIDYNVN